MGQHYKSFGPTWTSVLQYDPHCDFPRSLKFDHNWQLDLLWQQMCEIINIIPIIINIIPIIVIPIIEQIFTTTV
jgi:hypothetical protein